MNKNLTPEKSALFRNKLSKILEKLYKERDERGLQTEEDYVREAVKLLSLFHSRVSSTNFNPSVVRPGTAPSVTDWNENLEDLLADLDISFQELENLEGVILEHFNLFQTQANRLQGRIKKIASKVIDYELYAGLAIKDSAYFGDSFADLSKVDTGSSLVNSNECQINQTEGIITLPLVDEEVLALNEKPLINSNSNGRAGNNFTSGPTNDNISVVLDDNPDTWFEYERVVDRIDDIPLILDLSVNLGTREIINFIRVNPNNFGTKTDIEIVDISTSADGSTYLSIKDDVPITSFVSNDEENLFRLGPATGKYAGQGLYTFTPRYAKYVRFQFRQSSPYVIDTTQGQKFRYAIGLRDIVIARQTYQSEGELVSQVFTANDDIRKVTVEASQNPLVNNELVAVEHRVSFDEGNSWHQIQPLIQDAVSNEESTIPEVLNINTGEEGAIDTGTNVNSFRYKATLSRNGDNFTNSSYSFVKSVVPFSELKKVTYSNPSFLLSNNPIVDSISVINPLSGSRGNESVKYLLGYATGGRQSLTLPWNVLKMYSDLEKDNNYVAKAKSIIRLFVGGEEWSQVPSVTGTNEKYFRVAEVSSFLTANAQTLTEIDLGFAGTPTAGQAIEVVFTEERLYPVNSDHIAKLEFPTSIDKADVEVKRIGATLPATSDLSPGATVHVLDHKNIIEGTLVFSSAGSVFTDEQTYSNGLASPEGELSDAGDYSVDWERGVIYSFSTTDNSPGTVSYRYEEQEILPQTRWDWGDDLPLHKSIKILDAGWVPNSTSNYEAPNSGVNVVHLPDLSIVRGSIEITKPSGVDEADDPFLEEVEFTEDDELTDRSVRARTPELYDTYRTEDEIPVLAPVGNIATFTTLNDLSSDSSLGVSFSDTTTFSSEKGSVGAIAALGDYHINRSTNTITVHTGGSTVSEPGTIYYWATDPSRVSKGAYSVDYKRGIIYTQRLLPSTGYKFSYKYSDYRIQYNVARELPKKDAQGNTNWTFSTSTNEFGATSPQITIFSNELVNQSTPDVERSIPYQVNYNYIGESREGIADLEPYFSPVLRDYKIRIVTKGNL